MVLLTPVSSGFSLECKLTHAVSRSEDACLCGGGYNVPPALNCIECGGDGKFNATALTELGEAMKSESTWQTRIGSSHITSAMLI